MALTFCVLLINLVFIVNAETGRCSQKGQNKLDCSQRNLTDVSKFNASTLINNTEWNLSFNTIRVVANYTFEPFGSLTVIDLSFNEISVLEVHCFVGLQQLKVLNISENQLTLPTSFTPGLFEPLTALEVLRMEGTNNKGAYPDQALQHLENLKELYIQGTGQAFGSGFVKLQQLRVLYLSPPGCLVHEIHNSTFQHLRNSSVEILGIQSCDVRQFDQGALVYFPFLKSLSVVCNKRLGIRRVLTAIANIPNNQVETLVLDSIEIHDSAGEYQNFFSDVVCLGVFPHLKRLSIRSNLILRISMDILKCMPALEVFNVGFNNLLIYQLNDMFAPTTRQFWENCNLTELDFTYAFGTNIVKYEDWYYCTSNLRLTEDYFRPKPALDSWKLQRIPFEPTEPTQDKTLRNFVSVNPRLQILHLDFAGILLTKSVLHFMWREGSVSSPECDFVMPRNDFRFVNFSHNVADTFDCVLRGMNHLQTIDISHNQWKRLNVEIIESLPNLRVVFMSGNRFGSDSSLLSSAIKALTKAEHITLSRNGIKTLPEDTFQNNKELHTLDLSHNFLSDLAFTMKNLSSLANLDISFNELPSLQFNFVGELSSRPSLNKTLKLNLKGNPFQCNCDAIDFLKFAKQILDYKIVFEHFEEYACQYDGKNIHITEVDVASLEAACAESSLLVTVSATLSSIIVLLIIISVLVYKYRWKIAWNLYKARRHVRLLCSRENVQRPQYA